MNQKDWAESEGWGTHGGSDAADGRSWHHAYVVAGQIGQGGVGLNWPPATIVKGRLNVPAECWKVIVFKPREDAADDLIQITAAPADAKVEAVRQRDCVRLIGLELLAVGRSSL